MVKPGGVVAFTDWIETGPMSDELWTALNAFMVFPYLETLERLREAGGVRRVDVVEQRGSEPRLRPPRAALSRCAEQHPPYGRRAGYGQLMYDDVQRGSRVAGRVGGRSGGPRPGHREKTVAQPPVQSALKAGRVTMTHVAPLANEARG